MPRPQRRVVLGIAPAIQIISVGVRGRSRRVTPVYIRAPMQDLPRAHTHACPGAHTERTRASGGACAAVPWIDGGW